MTSKEDIFITELFKVGVGVCSIDDTDYLKKVCAKSAKVKNIVENLKGSNASTIVKDLMLAQCYQINLIMKSFYQIQNLLIDVCYIILNVGEKNMTLRKQIILRKLMILIKQII